MKKIVIYGFYGKGNLGDEAILQSFMNIFNQHNIKVVVAARDPEKVRQQYGVDVFDPYKRNDFLKRWWHLKTCSLFIMGGGGLLKDYGDDSKSLEKWLSLLNYADKLGVKTALGAIGVENIRFDESKVMLEHSLENVDIITVRDVESKELLRDCGVKNKIDITADPALLLAPKTFRKQRKPLTNKPKILVSLRHWFAKGFYVEDSSKEDNLFKSIAALLDHLVYQYDAEIHFTAMRNVYYDNDNEVSLKVKSFMKNQHNVVIHQTVPTVDEFIESLKNIDLVVGMRLHSLIIGASMGIPLMAVEYMPKVKNFMKSIDQSEFSFNPENLNKDILVKSSDLILNNYLDIQRSLVKEIEKSCKQVENTLGKFITIAEGGKHNDKESL